MYYSSNHSICVLLVDSSREKKSDLGPLFFVLNITKCVGTLWMKGFCIEQKLGNMGNWGGLLFFLNLCN